MIPAGLIFSIPGRTHKVISNSTANKFHPKYSLYLTDMLRADYEYFIRQNSGGRLGGETRHE